MTASYFTEQQLNQLSIQKMIIHLVGPNESDYEEFDDCDVSSFGAIFDEMFRDAAKGQRCNFLTGSGVQQTLASDPVGRDFVATSKIMASLFQAKHPKNALPGAFVWAMLNVGGSVYWASLKYDKGSSLRYERTTQNGMTVFQVKDVSNPMPTDSKTLQKSVLITGVNPGDEVCVNQRNNSAASNYLLNWLDVERSYSDADGTEKLKKALQKTVTRLGTALHRNDRKSWAANLHGAASANGIFDTSATAAFLGQIFPQSTNRDAINKAFDQEVRAQKIAGTSFSLDASIAKKPTMTIIEGSNGVQAKYADSARLAGEVDIQQIDGTQDVQVTMTIKDAIDTLHEP